jgi:competence protein ComEC
MQINAAAVGWIVGICLVSQQAALPSYVSILFALTGLVFVGIGVRFWGASIGGSNGGLIGGWIHGQWINAALLGLALCVVAMGWATWRANARLAEQLPAAEDNKVTRVIVKVIDLPTDVGNGVRFIGQLQAPVPRALPSKVMVFWQGACTQACEFVVKPGQQWRMALRFRYPRARLNFAGLDAEGWMFQQGIRATATVRGTPKRLAHASGWQPGIWIEQLRAHIRARLQAVLSDYKEINVMVALAIGDQQGVSREDWEIFNLTGITHLVSISGSHVTLIAALGAAGVAAVYRRLRWRGRWLAEHMPVRLVFVWAAGILAFLYCLLAGWGVPAQRTFFMLSAGAIGLSGRVPLTGTQAVLGAALVMTVLDPWAVLSTGFWLSFGAMMILIVLAEQVFAAPKPGASVWHNAKQACLLGAHLQWIMTLAITPVTIYLFQQVSLIGLLANAWAIPWVTFVATPAALLVSALSVVPLPDNLFSPLAWVAHLALQISLAPVRWLGEFEALSFETAAIGQWELLLGLAGVAMALMLPPWRWRWLAWLWLLPALVSVPAQPEMGHWRLTAFDVGQGGAVLVQTRRQALLFDTGWRYQDVNAVDRVLLAELRAMGVKHLDRVVISHPDMDHVGGLERLEQVRSIGQLLGSGLQRTDASACRAGQSWQADGVTFTFLHPQTDCSEKALTGRARNQCSCVLSIQGQTHRAILTGDIDTTVEEHLARTITDRYDVAMVAHHGSDTSSHPAWVRVIDASHAVIQAGHYNRFGHPDPEVLRRWRAHGTRLWVSSWHGAVQFNSTPSGLDVTHARDQRRRYWQEAATDLQ